MLLAWWAWQGLAPDTMQKVAVVAQLPYWKIIPWKENACDKIGNLRRYQQQESRTEMVIAWDFKVSMGYPYLIGYAHEQLNEVRNGKVKIIIMHIKLFQIKMGMGLFYAGPDSHDIE